MEDKKTKKIYFLYSQKGQNNNIQNFELNDKINNVQDISKDVLDDTTQVIYCIEISNYEQEDEINISLINIQGIKYICNIPLENLKVFPDLNEAIIFNLLFEPFDELNANYLDQILLPYKDQFDCFEKKIKDNEQLMISLFFSTINEILLKSRQKFDFILIIAIFNYIKYY